MSRQSGDPKLLGLSRRHLSPRTKERAWVWRMGNSVMGIASVRPRRGRRSWEVPALHIGAASDRAVSELLGQVARSAAVEGAERIFLRLRIDNEATRAARVGGFFPCMWETLFERPLSATNNLNCQSFISSVHMRTEELNDQFGLFRLYNAATPTSVRSLVGMTLEQWQASHEQCAGHREQQVFEWGDSIRGAICTTISSRASSLSATIHPDDAAFLPNLVDIGLSRLSSATPVLCLVPEYQVSLGLVLKERGFEPVDQFVTLVKSLKKTSRYANRARSALSSPGTT
ncbi:hypothetical protein M1N23_03155 [Dehalococcoidia bacterium]|nr:hypothetical protein [Dehalococcoidia bacterium]